ncbi:hypothetical protein ACFFGH_32415 [Lysobacter korlensis]|uniref:Peptidase M15A C-terminal domain-containing protein n=1 Tax=Lysobacter korlensis TaxID=553636 RepID=A0ABV6RZZ6_9GAMM
MSVFASRKTAGALLLLALFGPGIAEAQAPLPAKVVAAGELPGSVGYVTVKRSPNDVIDANVGRWDTPYPYPDTGERAPGLQPTGFSTFYVDIDVNDGGTAVLSYLMQTYDAGVWDWYDIYMQTPDGEVQLVTRLGKPGRQYGTYWTSPRVSLSQSLNKWRNQRVRFVFRVQQDGWGDQTQGQVIGFSLSNCPVPPLSPITDPAAISFESGNRIVIDRLVPAAQTGLACMKQAVAQLGGSWSLSSAYRPPSYQTHLREVWDRWKLLRNNTNAECSALKSQVRSEFQGHSLLVSQRPAAGNPNAPHARGIAFDVSIRGLPAGHTVDTVAASCNMYRPWPVNDPPHYHPR